MELELLKLIYDYSRNGLIADKHFIDKVVEIVVDNRRLHSFVNKVDFVNELNKIDDRYVLAVYNPHLGLISVDYQSLGIYMDDMSGYDGLFLDFEQIMFKNILITQVLLHELEHALQYRQVNDESDNSIETELSRVSFKMWSLTSDLGLMNKICDDDELYNQFLVYKKLHETLLSKCYEVDPSERFADINSYKILAFICDEIRNSIPNLSEFIDTTYLESLLRGYKEISKKDECPTKLYLEKMKHIRLWKNFDFYSEDNAELLTNINDKYDLVKRLYLGLPIFYEEYKDMQFILETSNKFSI